MVGSDHISLPYCCTFVFSTLHPLHFNRLFFLLTPFLLFPLPTPSLPPSSPPPFFLPSPPPFFLPSRPSSSLSSQVITLHRPLRCCHWCCFCCLQEVEVQSPPGATIGYIQQDFTFLYPWFSIQNEDRQTLLKLKGPCCCYTWGDVEFEVGTGCLSVCVQIVWSFGYKGTFLSLLAVLYFVSLTLSRMESKAWSISAHG